MIPAHADRLLRYLSAVPNPVRMTDLVLFDIWRTTDLEDVDIIAGLDYLATVGRIVRDHDRGLRCEVRVRT